MPVNAAFSDEDEEEDHDDDSLAHDGFCAEGGARGDGDNDDAVFSAVSPFYSSIVVRDDGDELCAEKNNLDDDDLVCFNCTGGDHAHEDYVLSSCINFVDDDDDCNFCLLK